MLLLECLEVRKDIFRAEQPGTLYTFALISGLTKICLQSHWYHSIENCMLIILVQKSEKLSQ